MLTNLVKDVDDKKVTNSDHGLPFEVMSHGDLGSFNIVLNKKIYFMMSSVVMKTRFWTAQSAVKIIQLALINVMNRLFVKVQRVNTILFIRFFKSHQPWLEFVLNRFYKNLVF